MDGLTDRIRDEAKRLGFTGVGITPARPLPHAERFDDWLRSGMQGEMHYMDRQADRRRDPSRVLSSVQSMLVLAMNYFTPPEHSSDDMTGKISRYAWGDDYHALMGERLRLLHEYMVGLEPQAEGLYYVDTGPVMEKVWGASSALGWMGKHSNLIRREGGSWFFIGVILTSLELEADPPERDFCGSCTRCIPACPTGAIVAPYVVDARLCISYLTIELRGSIPRSLRPLIGSRIFGCDDCQDVCPWNRFAVSSPEPEFQPRPGNTDLASLVTITPEAFGRRFRNSPVRRAKRDGFVRNVAVALGNSRRPEAVVPLTVALHDASPLVRGHAAWALGQIGVAEARSRLLQALEHETDPEVVTEIRLALRAAEEKAGDDAEGVKRRDP